MLVKNISVLQKEPLSYTLSDVKSRDLASLGSGGYSQRMALPAITALPGMVIPPQQETGTGASAAWTGATWAPYGRRRGPADLWKRDHVGYTQLELHQYCRISREIRHRTPIRIDLVSAAGNNVNKFVRKLTLRHFSSRGMDTEYGNSYIVEETPDANTDTNTRVEKIDGESMTLTTFQEQCCLTDLVSLRGESGVSVVEGIEASYCKLPALNSVPEQIHTPGYCCRYLMVRRGGYKRATKVRT
ncbi:hypothetical protein XELAEV_18000543mg [Xenopus laevis]|nr:hypothetical protein XELAEV_18000543mg [Xenopus laevis]